MQILDELKFDSNGLIPAIIQDYENNDVLMMGYMNREPAPRTLESGRVTFWCRSRHNDSVKGETSGHTQDVRTLAFDCDADTLLIKVVQKGGACHEGYRSCFFREVSPNGNSARIVGTKVFDPGAVYS